MRHESATLTGAGDWPKNTAATLSPDREDMIVTDQSPSAYGDERPDTDDYDLLTYGEVAVRITEVLEEEQGRLAELERSGASEADTAVLRQRVADLAAGRTRYQEHAATSETFMRRFGLTPRNTN